MAEFPVALPTPAGSVDKTVVDPWPLFGLMVWAWSTSLMMAFLLGMGCCRLCCWPRQSQKKDESGGTVMRHSMSWRTWLWGTAAKLFMAMVNEIMHKVRPGRRIEKPLRQSPGRSGRASPTRSPFKRPYSGGDAAKADSWKPRFKSGGIESVGRAPRDGVRDAKFKRRSRKNQGQKPKQSPGDDAGGCEPGSKPSLDGIAGLAASPAWLERARARFERKFYAEGTWSSRASKRRKV